MIINTAILIQEYTFRPPFSTVLQNLRFSLKICTTAPHQTSKTALFPSLFVMQTSVCTDMLSHPHYPLPRTTTLASLVKGRWLDGKPQTVALLRFTSNTSAFLFTKLFCRQDGGIAIPPFAQHHIYASLVKGEVQSPEKIRATTGGIATPNLSIPTIIAKER